MSGQAANKRYRTQLQSGKTPIILQAINKLREHGSNDLLPDVIELLHDTKEELVKTSIISFLNDLKLQESTVFIINAIKNKQYQSDLDVLTSSCWQSGLDYSKHIDVFINLILQSEYTIAIDAFTVIENCIANTSASDRMRFIDILKDGIKKSEENKKILITELINVINSIGYDDDIVDLS